MPRPRNASAGSFNCRTGSWGQTARLQRCARRRRPQLSSPCATGAGQAKSRRPPAQRSPAVLNSRLRNLGEPIVGNPWPPASTMSWIGPARGSFGGEWDGGAGHDAGRLFSCIHQVGSAPWCSSRRVWPEQFFRIGVFIVHEAGGNRRTQRRGRPRSKVVRFRRRGSRSRRRARAE